MFLITETSYDVQILLESKSKGLHVVGIFSSAEVENINKRKYRRDTLTREVNEIGKKIEKRYCWGELGHPPTPEINPERIAILTEELEWKGNNLYGKAKVLDTPMGKIAQTLVNEGRMGISSRGLGTVGDDSYVNDDYRLITWDLVTDPSNDPSWVNGIYEGKEWKPIVEKMAEEENISIEEAQEKYYEYLKKYLSNMKI